MYLQGGEKTSERPVTSSGRPRKGSARPVDPPASQPDRRLVQVEGLMEPVARVEQDRPGLRDNVVAVRFGESRELLVGWVERVDRGHVILGVEVVGGGRRTDDPALAA